MDGWLDGMYTISKWMDGYIDGLDIISKWMNVWIESLDIISKWMDGWIDRLDAISKWMDGWIGYHFKAGQWEVAKRPVIKNWVLRSQRCDCCREIYQIRFFQNISDQIISETKVKTKVLQKIDIVKIGGKHLVMKTRLVRYGNAIMRNMYWRSNMEICLQQRDVCVWNYCVMMQIWCK